MFLLSIQICGFILPLLASARLWNTTTSTTTEQHLLEDLDHVIDFLIDDLENVNADCFFGLIMIEGQLNLMLKKLPSDSDFYNKIANVKEKCHKFIKELRPDIEVPTAEYNKIIQSVMKTELWQHDADFRNGVLQELPLFPNWEALPQDVLLPSNPSEQESDVCVAELVEQGPSERKHDCLPSKRCALVMFDLDKSNGYSLTHKLLYIQIARALNCALDASALKTNLEKVCSRILQEHRSLEKFIDDKIELRDLYTEQMLLCGYEGYTEFLRPKARGYLHAWQNAAGCYGSRTGVVEDATDRVRSKRLASAMKHGCTNHFTGLAGAALALNLRYLLFTALQQDAY